jgi:hypothetical protein
MFKLAFILLLMLAGCAGSSADSNRNRLATVTASYGAVQVLALAYIDRTPCSRLPRIVLCSDPSTVRLIQGADRSAISAINRANEAVKANPSDPSLPQLINGAVDAVDKFKSVTPKEGT